jgi:hypothetical protein
LLWVHGIFDAGLLRQYNPLVKYCEDIVLQTASRIVFCSQWTSDGYLARCENKKATVIHNWTDCAPVVSRIPGKKKNFVMLSTLEAHKGIDVAIRAVALLREQGVAVTLDIYSDGADKHLYVHLVGELKLKKQVRFHGRVDDVNAVYDSAFALLFPSYVEPFGMLAIEAMARALPVIAAQVGGLKEIITGNETGLFFKAGDSRALADRMKQLLDSPELAEKIGRTGKEHTKAFFNGDRAIEAFCDAIENTYRTFTINDERSALAVSLFDAFTPRLNWENYNNFSVQSAPAPRHGLLFILKRLFTDTSFRGIITQRLDCLAKDAFLRRRYLKEIDSFLVIQRKAKRPERFLAIRRLVEVAVESVCVIFFLSGGVFKIIVADPAFSLRAVKVCWRAAINPNFRHDILAAVSRFMRT